MRRLVLLVVLTSAFLYSQYRELLRPDAVHFAGLVVDRNGKPVRDVQVGHHGNIRQTVATDARGMFDVQTQAPAIVLRKEGYRSLFLRTSEPVPTPIILDAVEQSRLPKPCTTSSRCESIQGWSATFCFPPVPRVQASKQGRDIDYGVRRYVITTAQGHAGITHGSSPMWSFGTPPDTDVWKSVTYQEVVYSADKLNILDARGRTADGKCWRYVGKFGESASYSSISEDAARILDRVLDDMCVHH